MKAGKRERVEASLIEMSDGLVADTPLTEEDRRACQALATEGFHFFDKDGWGPERERAFLARPSVRRELDRLIGLMQDAGAIKERHRFFSQIKLYQMLPAALVIVQQTLLGGRKDKDGKVIPPPTPDQLSVARDVIEWCGVSDGRGGTVNVNVGITAATIERKDLDNTSEAANKYDMGEVTRRTRVRSAIEAIIAISGNTDNQLSELDKERDDTVIRRKLRKKRRLREGRDE